jgi:hypothetical protein
VQLINEQLKAFKYYNIFFKPADSSSEMKQVGPWDSRKLFEAAFYIYIKINLTKYFHIYVRKYDFYDT